MIELNENAIIKRSDGTYIVSHNGLPYHVCDKETDPLGIYDIKEIAAEWDAKPDGSEDKLTQADENEMLADEQELFELQTLLGEWS